ncbi:MAG: 30S ribosomal protein S27e [Candidatus Nanoarchaeia archaeon]
MEKKFIKVKCHECAHEQIIFGRAASHVKCINCGVEIATPTGGKAAIRAEILEQI